MIPLLSLFKPKNQILNPWEKKFPSIFKNLKLKKGMEVIDMPCGQGGVSIPLVKKYGVKVTGYDIVPSYTRYATQLAKKKGVGRCCKFIVKDIREVVKQKNVCDLLLWVGPPHVWGAAKPTIKKLRGLVRPGGVIVIADAYLNPRIKKTGMLKNYENFKDTTKGYTSLGDKLIKVHDYKNSLWDFDYKRTRAEAALAVKRAKSKKDRKVVKRCLGSIDSFEASDTQQLGLAIWILKVRK